MTALTEQVEVKVRTRYLAGHPGEQAGKYAFMYIIAIHNHSDQDIQLLNRYWLITDGNGKNTEVQGPGVVGEQPIIAAGEMYEYNSGAMLDTPVGTMQGHYEMQCMQGDGATFNVPIPLFSLRVPGQIN